MTPALEEARANDLAYQAEILQGVSRTFALTIPELPDPLRAVVGNAYLLCRITDTIEDEPALSAGQKQRFWRRFVDVLANRDDAGDFAQELGALLSASTTASEHDLVANTPRVVRITNGFRLGQRRVLRRCVCIMSRGMREFQPLDASRRGLASLMQLDRYCYFVAGVVGETLTELFCDYSAEMNDRRDELLPLAVSFGQGLQMTNILKDVWEDRRRGACWLPRDIFVRAGFDLSSLCPGHNDPAFAKGMAEVVAIARRHLAEGLRFIELVPTRETGIRRHCLWALGLAALTLRRIHANPMFRSGRDVKVSRRSVWAITTTTSILARFDVALRLLFGALVCGLPLPRMTHRSSRPGTRSLAATAWYGTGLTEEPDEAAAGEAMPILRVLLAQPRGFCAGVERAIDTVEAALQKYGAPVYVRHEIVHNRHVVEKLKVKGVRFVEHVDEIPSGMVAVFSAHGVSARVEQAAAARGLLPIDATCPLVSKVHAEGRRYAADGYDIVLIGHENHPEVEGTVGQIPGRVLVVGNVEDVNALRVRDPEKVAYVTQTTLSVDDTREVIAALRHRFPQIVGPDVKDICYATQNRQSAVRSVASLVDLVLVVGARNSSNANRLCEVGNDAGVPTYLVEEPSTLDPAWLEGKKSVCITAGASTPEDLVQEVVEKLREYASLQISAMDGIVENVHFGLPVELDPATLDTARRGT